MGVRATFLADTARMTGYPVVEVAGWRTAGHGDFRVLEAVVGHHTGTPDTAKGIYPSLNVVSKGRAGLAGPLCNYGLGRDGTIFCVSAGVGWHAGASRYAGFTDLNDEAIGIEAEHAGGTTPWPAPQLDAYVKLVGAILHTIHRGAERYCSHRTCAVPAGRKPDPKGIADVWMQDRARDFMRTLAGGGKATPVATKPALGSTPVLITKGRPTMQNFPVHGAGKLRLICPIGAASSITGRAWLSAVSAGDGPGEVRCWAQGDRGGLADWRWPIGFANGLSDRPWRELPDGTTQINVHYNFPDGGTLCLETAPK